MSTSINVSWNDARQGYVVTASNGSMVLVQGTKKNVIKANDEATLDNIQNHVTVGYDNENSMVTVQFDDLDGKTFTSLDTGSEFIYNCKNSEILGTSGNDCISVIGDNNTVKSGYGEDVIYIAGNNNIVSGNEGNDYIRVMSGSNNSTYGYYGTDTVVVDSEAKNTYVNTEKDKTVDYIYNYGENTTIAKDSSFLCFGTNDQVAKGK